MNNNNGHPSSGTTDFSARLLQGAQRLLQAQTVSQKLQAVLDITMDALVRQPNSAFQPIDHVKVFRVSSATLGQITLCAGWRRTSTPSTRSIPSSAGGWTTDMPALPADPAADQSAEHEHVYSTGSAIEAIMAGTQLVLDDAQHSELYARVDEADRAFLASLGAGASVLLPLHISTDEVGLLYFACESIRTFSAEELDSCRELADQLGNLFMESALVIAALPAADETLGNIGHVAAALHNASDAFLIIDDTGTITWANSAAGQLMGYPTQQLEMQPLAMLVPASRRAELAVWQRIVIQEQRGLRGDSEAMRGDSEVFPCYLAMWPIRGMVDQAPNAAVVQVLDYSKRLAQQSALQREHDLLESILEAANDAIVMVDADRKIVTANLQFEAFFRLQRYQLINRSVDVLVEEARNRIDLPDALVNILLTFAGDSHQSAGGDFMLGGDRLREIVWYSSPVFSHDGSNVGRLYVFRDATKEREADRLKQEFVSLVSHELRTPLTSILGFTELILDDASLEIAPVAQQYLNIVKVNTDRLISLINDILDITRIENGRIEIYRALYYIDDVIDSVVQSMFLVIDSRQQQLTVKIEPDLPPVFIDRERITQSFGNLLSNASKYSPSNTELIVEVKLIRDVEDFAEGAPPDIFIPALQIAVHDSGMGISDTDKQRLFTRFYRSEQVSRRQISGSGLGLALAKSFIDLHGGHIWLQSTMNQGSSFYFSIPVMEA